MFNSTRYFQLTPDILVEYNYTDRDVLTNQSGDKTKYILDMLDENVNIVENLNNNCRHFLFGDYKDNFVFPINVSETKFTQYVEGGLNVRKHDMDITRTDSDVAYDNFKVHFTSKKYLGDYEGLIITANIYDEVKNKICLFSYYIRKTDDLCIEENPMLLNQKLYTTYLPFKIISTDALINLNYSSNNPIAPGEEKLKRLLSPDHNIMENTPLVVSIYGIKSIYKDPRDVFENYKTEKINTIYIPITDSYNHICVNIEEANDGDYFKIYPSTNDSGISFSDYLYRISNESPEIYMILHELTLTEHYVGIDNNPISRVTHREHYIANGSNNDGSLNEDGLEHVMVYRPVIMNSGRLLSFTIDDQLKIINTLDNTTIVKQCSLECSEENGYDPKKYGKRMKRIYLGEIPAQVNVYNKRPDEDIDTIKLTNNSSSAKIENHQHSITSFIECVNVGVTVEQLPVTSIE